VVDARDLVTGARVADGRVGGRVQSYKTAEKGRRKETIRKREGWADRGGENADLGRIADIQSQGPRGNPRCTGTNRTPAITRQPHSARRNSKTRSTKPRTRNKANISIVAVGSGAARAANGGTLVDIYKESERFQ
jgi:hypothetical protein